jgi:hypothetical protein
MMDGMIPLIIVAILASIPYFIYRAVRRWGVAVLFLLAATVSFVGGAGVVAEALWGPQWSWNLARHGGTYPAAAFTQGTLFLILGLNRTAHRR